MKRNKLIILAVLICLLGWIFYCFISYVKEDGNIEYNNRLYDLCLENEDYSTANEDVCNYIISNFNNYKKITFDTMTIFDEITKYINVQYLNFFIIIFVVAISLHSIIQILKNKIVINILNREKYIDFIKKLFFSAYKYAWVVPFTMLFLFFLCFIYAKHFDYSYRIFTGAELTFRYNMNTMMFIIGYIISLFFYNIFLINIGLITMRKNQNLVIVIIESFLIYLSVDLVIEIFFGQFLFKIITGSIYPISLFNQFNLVHFNNIWQPIGVELVLALVSAIVVYMLYSDKEKLIIDCEKNN